jgi:hypothetical protein
MIPHMVLSLVLAGVAVAILVEGLRCRPNTPVWGLFAILFLGIWAGGVWVAPAGPMHLGVYWLPFLLTAILLSVLVVVLVPQRTAGRHDEADIEREVEVGLGLFFWVLIVGLIAVVLTAYR